MSTAPTLTPPRIGTPWPGQGGIYAGIARGTDADYHLILATAKLGRLAWGGARKVPGANWERDGMANTMALLADKTKPPAAEACAALEVEGHHDFYLPARFELALLYANVRDHVENWWHWSSTQYDASYAWGCYFYDGLQYYYRKSYEGCAVAVRRFAAQSFGPSEAAC
ncbi:MAG: DUF1566 domain-containing protein [Variovorax sp.]|nr:DUF1566 domain-containing protein [Variovorax sp.]|tara:strand:+ start:86 stop:592 length:507 start_codon:yes stop_codon:yes gene_type:complete